MSTLHLFLGAGDVGYVPGILHVQTAYLGTATHDAIRNPPRPRRGQCRDIQIWRRAATYCEKFSLPCFQKAKLGTDITK
jgi:hypothetical protein